MHGGKPLARRFSGHILVAAIVMVLIGLRLTIGSSCHEHKLLATRQLRCHLLSSSPGFPCHARLRLYSSTSDTTVPRTYQRHHSTVVCTCNVNAVRQMNNNAVVKDRSIPPSARNSYLLQESNAFNFRVSRQSAPPYPMLLPQS